MGRPKIEDVDDKEVELRIRGHLDEISELNDEYIGDRQGFPMSREAYESSLTATALCADTRSVDEVASYIKSLFKKGERPSSRKVRRNARRIVSNNGSAPHSFIEV